MKGRAVPAILLLGALLDEAAGAPAVDLAGDLAAACKPSGGALMAPPKGGEGAYLFQSEYDPVSRSGSLTRRSVAPDAAGQVRAGAPLWEAGAILSGDAAAAAPRAPMPAPAARRIFTLATPAGKGPATIPFEWASLSEQQRALLNLSPDNAGVSDGLGEQRLLYLRGERSGEVGQPGGIFRRRIGILGAAIHGAPVYVGAPSGAARDAYAAFSARYKARRAAVYLGANDGMLHAFDAASGVELFAYVPQVLMGALNALTSPRYVPRPYVDGAAAAGDALTAGGWKTVLVSGMGGGAQGVIALDVSDPGHFEAGGALWEFTDQDDPAIGNVLAAPAIARFRTAFRDGVPVYRHFAVVASGFNNEVDDGKGRFLRAGAGALFLLALDKPAAQPWQRNVNYYRLTTPVSEAGAVNALGPPALVTDADGGVRYAYAGDLQGNLWRFDFSGQAPWAGSVGAQPLFVARDSSGARQPISAPPQVVFAPGGGYLILFGTGKYVEPADLDLANFQQQSFYAVRDPVRDPPVAGGRAALVPRILSGPSDSAAGFAVGGAGAGPAQGWYVDFPGSKTRGERSVGRAVLAGGKVLFNTIAPGGDACPAPGVRTYALDAISGFGIDDEGAARSGIVTGQLFADQASGAPLLWRSGTLAGKREATGRVSVRSTYQVLNHGKDGVKAAARALVLSAPAGRMSWREVANWRELHEAASK